MTGPALQPADEAVTPIGSERKLAGALGPGTVRCRRLAPVRHALRPAGRPADRYVAHDGSGPSLAMRVDALKALRVPDAGDVETSSGGAERSVRDLQEAVRTVATWDRGLPLLGHRTPSSRTPVTIGELR